ncbi:hypothetical protein [Aquimarina agarivorans]|nr:hypothetical protein [Aquimarina agarivorans]
MNALYLNDHHEFLNKWINRQLTSEEERSFLNSENYKSLVVSNSKSS